MPDLPRLAHWLRTWADRFDDKGAPKRAASLSFTFETGKGLTVREDGKGCPLYYCGDYERAHNEADSNQPDPLLEDTKRFLDAVDRGEKLPPGWFLEAQAGREEDRG